MKTKLIVAVALVALVGCKSKEERLKQAEAEGKELAEMKARLIKGVGEGIKGEGAEATKVVAEAGGELVKAANSGIDSSLAAVKVTCTPATTEKGINVTRASRMEKKHTISAFVKLDKAFSGPLQLRAFDDKKNEIGRASTEVESKGDDAKYVDFNFDERTPLMLATEFELH